MSGAPPPAVIPMLSYADLAAAADWLVGAFGFRETLRMSDDDGVVVHVELAVGDGLVMLGCPSPHYEGPRRHAEHCETARRWRENPYVVDGVHVLVDDVDAHHRRAAALYNRRRRLYCLHTIPTSPPTDSLASWGSGIRCNTSSRV